MARITRDGFEACMAFGAAALAVAEVGALVADRPWTEAPAICSTSSRPHITGSGPCSTSARTRRSMPWP